MRVFLDTSVLISAVIKQHADHERAFAVLERIHDKKDEGIISAHSLAEMYAVLTKLPPPYRHTPEQALLSIEENVLKPQEMQRSSRPLASKLALRYCFEGVLNGLNRQE